MDTKLMEDINEALEKNDKASAFAKTKEYLDREKNIPLNIAVTGETGSGKSTFVNAFRGIDHSDEGAAPTGCVETTMKATPYPHPKYPNVTLWDLPGVGTTNFPAKTYIEKVGLKEFDFFIIISATRFTENDVMIAQEIQKMGKKFYFVRSKIDIDLNNEERSQREFNAERTLKKIRDNCIKGLQKLGFESPQVFLVSNFDLQKFDFALLGETLERELPAHKRNVLLFAMPNISPEVIKKKKKAFHAKIKFYALLSAGAAGVPVPGLSVAVEVGILVSVAIQYTLGFGLDIPSLKRLAVVSHVPLKDLIDVIVSPLAAVKITPDLVLKVLLSLGTLGLTAALMTAEEGAKYIPALGIPVSMSLAFMNTYRILSSFLDMLADDAERVFKTVIL